MSAKRINGFFGLRGNLLASGLVVVGQFVSNHKSLPFLVFARSISSCMDVCHAVHFVGSLADWGDLGLYEFLLF